MARIELRDATIRIKDGLSGTSLINETTPGATDTDVDIDTSSINRVAKTKIPVAARFTVNTAGNVTEYVVTGRVLSLGVDQLESLAASGATAGTFTVTFNIDDTIDTTGVGPFTTTDLAFDIAEASFQTAVDVAMATLPTYVAGDMTVTNASTPDLAATTFLYGGSIGDATHPVPTVDGTGLTGGGSEAFTTTTPGEFIDQVTNITFSPAWGTPTPADDDVITWQAIEVEIKIGDGNLTYTENIENEYELDRGSLDTVKRGDDQPVDINLEFVYEFVSTGTSEAITPVDAVKGIRGAIEFTSSSADLCEPYAIDLEVEHDPGSCAGLVEKEITLFPDFRYDSLEFDLDEATIAVTGRCNATEPTITRV